MTVNPSNSFKRTLMNRAAGFIRAEQLQSKALEVFGRPEEDQKGHSLVVDKTIARQLGFDDLPRYVKEYLLGSYTTRKGRVNINRVRELIGSGRVSSDTINLFKDKLMEEGKAVLIGQVSISPSLDKGEHTVSVPQLGDTKIHIEEVTLRVLKNKHPALLSSAVWGIIGLSYSNKTTYLDTFTPYQLTMNPKDMARFKEGRAEFTILEWIDLLIMSMGYNPYVLEFGVDAGERERDGRVIYRPHPHPGDEWVANGKTYTLIAHPEWYVAYDTGERINTGKRDKQKQPILEPVLARPMYFTGKKNEKGQDIWAPVWTPIVNQDENTDQAVPVTDREGTPLYFHEPDLRRKLLMLARLLPLVVKNFNLVELGPRGTGKSFALRELSPKVYLLAGAKVTDAQLRGSLQTGRKTAGLLATYQTIVFDEIGATKFPDLSLVAALKDYLESGNFGRGQGVRMSDCSTVWGGNIDIAPNGRGPVLPDQSWFRVFPEQLNDTALFERFHAFIPGWELPKVTDEFVTPPGVGFLADYFGEVLSRFREERMIEDLVTSEVVVEAVADGKFVNPSLREQKAIHKMVTGFFRLLYPQKDAQAEPSIYELLFSICAELRQNIHDQLVKMSRGEYFPKKLSCRFK